MLWFPRKVNAAQLRRAAIIEYDLCLYWQSRYIGGLMKAAEKRQKEHERRSEKKVQKVWGWHIMTEWLYNIIKVYAVGILICKSVSNHSLCLIILTLSQHYNSVSPTYQQVQKVFKIISYLITPVYMKVNVHSCLLFFKLLSIMGLPIQKIRLFL
jgi:hypothetical protein